MQHHIGTGCKTKTSLNCHRIVMTITKSTRAIPCRRLQRKSCSERFYSQKLLNRVAQRFAVCTISPVGSHIITNAMQCDTGKWFHIHEVIIYGITYSRATHWEVDINIQSLLRPLCPCSASQCFGKFDSLTNWSRASRRRSRSQRTSSIRP
jgi:hypothetical protein